MPDPAPRIRRSPDGQRHAINPTGRDEDWHEWVSGAGWRESRWHHVEPNREEGPPSVLDGWTELAVAALPVADGWGDAVDEHERDSLVPYWERTGTGVITAYTGGVEIDGDYTDNLTELRDEALAVLAAVQAAEQYAAEHEERAS